MKNSEFKEVIEGENKKIKTIPTNKGEDFVANFDINKNIKRIADKKTIEPIEIGNKYINESRADYRDRLKEDGLNEQEIKEKLIERTNEMTKKALDDLIPLIDKDILNRDSGLVLNGSKGDMKHLLKNERSEIKSTICSELDKLIDSSILLKKHPPKKAGDERTLKDVYIFGNIIKLNGKLYATRLTALHYIKDDRIGEYNLDIKEIESLATTEVGGSTSKINIKYLLENIKDEKDKYFSGYL